MSARAAAPAFVLALALGLSACESVPDIHFVDAGDPSTLDSDIPDSTGTEAEGADTARPDVAPAACPASPPTGFDGCCDATPCKGVCTTTACARCGTCPGTDICCARNVNPVCKPAIACN